MDVIVVTDRRYGERVRDRAARGAHPRRADGPQHGGLLALATVAVRRPDDEQMLVICADHEIDQDDTFREAMATVAVDVVHGAAGVERPLVTFGIRPTGPDPQFSYIQPGYDDGVRVGKLRVYPVIGFEAKPEDGRTRSCRVRHQLLELGRVPVAAGRDPRRDRALHAAVHAARTRLSLELALRAAYDRIAPISIDEAILTGAARDGAVLTAPLEVGWQDLSTTATRLAAAGRPPAAM